MHEKIIIHLSDFHVGRKSKELEHTNKIFDWIAKQLPNTPVLITGDLVDSAIKKQFKLMRESLEILSQTNPILMVPGNHDYAWKGNILRDDGWENWVKYLGSPLGWGRDEISWMGVNHEPEGVDGLGVWVDGPYVYFGIDSGDPKDKQISARGYISNKLCDALSDVLSYYSDKIRVVFLHHHPFDDWFFTKLHGAEKLMATLEGNCEVLFFGHEHQYGLWLSKNIPLIVSSHKSTNFLSGDCLGITVVTIKELDGRVLFDHKLMLVT